jgi:hypothetical protein
VVAIPLRNVIAAIEVDITLRASPGVNIPIDAPITAVNILTREVI